MSNRIKRSTIWFRFKFKDTPNVRANIMKEADRLFAVTGVEERRQFTEEEVVNMVHNAILKTTDYKYTPKLYDALMEAMQYHCSSCVGFDVSDIPISDILKNCQRVDCCAHRWLKLLQKVMDGE